MKIKSLQTGGFMAFQSIPTMPEPSSQTEEMQAASSAKPAEETGVLDKSILKEMIGKGITNDVIAFADSLNEAYNKYSALNEFQKKTAYGRKLRSYMQGGLGELNALVQSNEDFKDAKQNVKDKLANDEFAVTPGGMIVKNMKTGEIQEVSAEEYVELAKNTKEYRPMTNAELMNDREYNKNLAFNNKPIEVLKYATGIQKVKEELWGILKYVGSTTQEKTGNSIIDGSNEEMAKALNIIADQAKQGIYDVTQMNSVESNSQQLTSAATAMWENMSESARSVLKARAAARGAQDVEKAAQESMIALLNPYYNVKTKESTIAKSTTNAADSASGGSGAKMGYWQAAANRAGSMQNVTMNLGNNLNYNATAHVMSPFMKGDGNLYGVSSVADIKELAGLVDMNSISFGDKHIKSSQADGLVYTGDKVRSYEMPVKHDVDANGSATGTISPDFETMKIIDKAEKAISSKGGSKNPTIKESVYKSFGLPTDGKGNLALETKVFFEFDAYAHEGMLGKDPESDLIIDVSDDNDATQLYEKMYLYGGKEATSKNQIDRPGYDKPWSWGNYHVVKSKVFIPMATTNFMGTQLDKNENKIGSTNQMTTDQRIYTQTGNQGTYTVDKIQTK